MYCYKCGGKVLPSANFCHHCGADLTLVHETSSDVKDSSPAEPEIDLDDTDTSQETKIFKMPMQEDEEELAHYIKKIDENVQQEVLTQEEKKKSLDRQAKARKKEVKEDQGPKTQEKSRRSFKDIWDSFIDESDNPYSVFSQPEDEPKASTRSDAEIKEENIILINEEAERSHNPSEDRFQTASDISNLTRQVNEALEQEAKNAAKQEAQNDTDQLVKSETTRKEKPAVKEKSTGGSFKNFFKSFTKDSSKSKDKDLTTDVKKVNPEITETSSDKTQVMESETISSGEVKEAPTEEKITHPVNKEQKSFKRPKFFSKAKDPSKTSDTTKAKPTKTKTREKNYLPKLAEVHKRYQQIIYKILDYGQKGMIALFAVGLIALILPFVLIDTKISVAVILFMLIKILISFFTIYYAYLVATRNTGLYLDEKRIFVYAGLNWTIINLVLFIFFLFYPHNTAIGYNFLGALTPKLIPTIVSYVLVSFLTLSCLYEDLNKDNYINFMGWFLTLYIGIELASKLFWVLIDFIFNSIL